MDWIEMNPLPPADRQTRILWEHVKAFYEGATLVQALIENVVREDLGSLDMAHALKALKDATGWSDKELALHVGMSRSRVSALLALLKEPEEVQQLLTQLPAEGLGQAFSSAVTAHHIQLVRSEKLPEEQHIQVLQKAAEEGLTAAQTREVA